MDTNNFLGIVENGRFTVLIPEAAGCCSVKLTKVEHPAIPESDAVRQHAIDLKEYEGKALMVSGSLPKFEGWLYGANILDASSPILTIVVKKLFGRM
ncbi:MAG: hypothetical protein WB392_13420 [Methanotrichaceae archaeon]